MRSFLLAFAVLGLVACSKSKEAPVVGVTEVTSGFVDTGYGATVAPVMPASEPAAAQEIEEVPSRVERKAPAAAPQPANDESSN